MVLYFKHLGLESSLIKRTTAGNSQKMRFLPILTKSYYY